jgi:hypothetical protein
MKKLMLTLTVILSVLSSCSSTDENERVSSVLNEKNTNSQRLAFNLLNGNEKLKLWTDQLNEMIKEDNLNQDQLNLVNELLNKLNATIFDTSIVNNDEREIFMNIFAPDFVERARSIFNDEYVYNNFYRIRKQPKALEPIGGIVGTNDCACNKSSYFTCGFSTYECKASTCEVLVDGCGFLGMFECNGKCS